MSIFKQICQPGCARWDFKVPGRHASRHACTERHCRREGLSHTAGGQIRWTSGPVAQVTKHSIVVVSEIVPPYQASPDPFKNRPPANGILGISREYLNVNIREILNWKCEPT
jgi:hypothetical protein